MIDAQRTARKALLPLLSVVLNSSSLQAVGLSASKDTAPDDVDSSRAQLIALPPAEGIATGNLAVVAQGSDSLSGDINPIGNDLAAFNFQRGRALDASIVQHGNHNQELIVQSGAATTPTLNNIACTTAR